MMPLNSFSTLKKTTLDGKYEMKGISRQHHPINSFIRFSFCEYPFALCTALKGEILKTESKISMRHELQDTFFRAIFEGVGNPYLQLEIRREFVVRDTLCQLENKNLPHELRKQLKIVFQNEDGIDEGGVQKGTALKRYDSL